MQFFYIYFYNSCTTIFFLKKELYLVILALSYQIIPTPLLYLHIFVVSSLNKTKSCIFLFFFTIHVQQIFFLKKELYLVILTFFIK